MDFTLDKKHEMARGLFRDFAETEVKPLAQETDETEQFPAETVAKMAKYGFMGIPVPKEYGGQCSGISEEGFAGFTLPSAAAEDGLSVFQQNLAGCLHERNVGEIDQQTFSVAEKTAGWGETYRQAGKCAPG